MKQKHQKTQKLTKPETISFLEHFTELKSRFYIWLLFLLLFSVIGYFLYPTILSLLTKPLGKPLYYTSPVGAFEVVFNTSLFFGFLVSLPVLFYEVIVFLRPAFKTSLYSLCRFILISFLLALSGIAVCYFFFLPSSLRFLSQFGGRELTALISTYDYFSFVMKFLVSFALIFQLPPVILIIHKLSPLNVKKLLVNFRYIFLIAFLLAAILTPTPDLINQSIMAAPILLLYLVSVGIVWWISPARNPLKKGKKDIRLDSPLLCKTH